MSVVTTYGSTTSGGGGLLTSHPTTHQALWVSSAVPCTECGASVEDTEKHQAWHLVQEERLKLVEGLLRDVLVDKVDFDKLLGL